MNKNLDYLDLEINFKKIQLNRKTTSEEDKLICFFKENFKHRLHSNSNNENFEQLNTIVDLLSNLSQHIKTNIRKIEITTEKQEKDILNSNLSYIKDFLEDKLDKSNLTNITNKINNLAESVNKIGIELEEVKKQVNTILYG